eukprot:TRINITY_DN43_c0_g2_i3.p1 TRINITY_DN43_c0_g2~~TRINITY_DN43_c0_g2_i3.p1  ORF type:complete len:426 (-),score=174.65 TRINITY_DN43_c0_g2_i3:128-1360(-)
MCIRDSSTSETIKALETEGITAFSESGSEQKMKGVRDQFWDKFMPHMVSSIKVPIQYQDQFEEFLQSVITSEENEWIEFSCLFNVEVQTTTSSKKNETEKHTKFVEILAKHDFEGKKTDWVITDIEKQFTLTKEVFAIQTCSFDGEESECKIKSLDDEEPDTEVETILKFMKLAAYQHLNLNSYVTMNDLDENVDPVAITVLVCEAIKAVCKIWSMFAKFFGGSKSVTVKGILQGKGYSYFASSCQTEKNVGVRIEYIEPYLNSLANRIQVPKDKQESFKEVLKEALWGDSQTWKAHDTTFSSTDGGQIFYTLIMMNYNETHGPNGSLNVIYSSCDAEFKLAPNLIVMETKVSYLGGAFGSSKQSLVVMPRQITTEDIQTIFNFFYVVGIRNAGVTAGVVVPAFPEIPPS